MPDVDALYAWLALDRSVEADAVLGAALLHAEPPYDARLAELLLARRRDTAWRGLASAYTKLTEAQRRRFEASPTLLRAGIAGALKHADPECRRSGLLALERQPSGAQLAHVLVDSLRDGRPDNRALAAHVLREQLARWLERRTAEHRSDDESSNEEALVVRAVHDGVRTFALHGRLEAIEICLWFAAELGSQLWDVLEGGKAPLARIVAEQLPAWDHPRLAGFLLRALGRAAWRNAARNQLMRWSARDHLIALLRQSPLLADPEIRRGLAFLKRPPWFHMRSADVAKLPADVRAQMPYWACYLGYTEMERLNFLRVCQASPLVELHRSAVYALAGIDATLAVRLLGEVAARPCPMNRFARWHLHGRRMMASAARRVRDGQAVESAAPTTTRGAP